MRRFSIVLAAVFPASLFLASCGTLPPDKLPSVRNADEAAEFTIIRDNIILNAAVAANVTVDGWIAGHLFNGQYMTIRLNPGQHTVGLPSSTVALAFEPHQKVYFLVVIKPYAKEIRRIDESTAMGFISRFNRIQVR